FFGTISTDCTLRYLHCERWLASNSDEGRGRDILKTMWNIGWRLDPRALFSRSSSNS
ncbi:unnamed protein product, partial [Dicrocoelium dendriticum]